MGVDAFSTGFQRGSRPHGDTVDLPFVSVIVPVYDDVEGLTLCLESLNRQSYDATRYEIIVVDNGCESDISKVTSVYPAVKLEYEERTGSYAARNKGISVARGDVLAFTDSDCVADSNWLSAGVSTLVQAQNIGLVGGKVDFHYAQPGKPSFWEAYDSIAHFDQETYIEARGFSVTANLFTTRKIIEDVGLFDLEMRSGGDREWSGRVKKAGYRLMYADEAIVFHPARSTFQELLQKSRRTSGGMQYLSASGAMGERKHAFWHDLSPPMKLITRALGDQRSTLSRRICLAMAAVLFKYVRAMEKVRIALGGKALR